MAETNKDAHINSFSKGMNKDTHPSIHQQGEYLDALNAVYNSTNNGNMFFLSNEEGFSIFSDFYKYRKDYLIIGICPINDRIVLFSIKTDINLKTQASEIGYLVKEGEGYVYKEVLNDTIPNYFYPGYYDLNELINYNDPEQLRFDIRYQIQATARIFFNNHAVVYWTDGFNPPRYIDIDVDYKTLDTQFTHLAQQVELFDNFDYPVVQYDNQIDGGSLKAGVYQFSVRYLNNTLDPTPFGYLSNIIPVIDDYKGTNANPTNRKFYDGVNFEGPLVSKSIQLTIANIDIDYDYLEVAVLYFSGSASQPKSFIWKRIPITNKVITVIFDGTVNLTELTIQELVEVPNSYSTAKHIIQKDGRLFLSNLTQTNSLDLQPIANRLKIGYVVEEIEYKENDIRDYSEEMFTYNKKGYQRQEAYSFAISAVTNNGETFAFHIPSKLNTIQYPNDIPSSIGGKTLAVRTSGTSTGPNPVTCEGTLGTYFSENQYLEKNKYIISGVDLYRKPIRHHYMPTYYDEPHFRVDTTTNKTFIRILGVKILNLDSVLASYPSLASRIKSINFLREKRDTPNRRSIFAMGLANTMLRQDGIQKPASQTTLQDNNIIAENGIPSYCVNPFYGNTHIHDYDIASFCLGRFTYRKLTEQLDDPSSSNQILGYYETLLTTPGAVVNSFGDVGAALINNIDISQFGFQVATGGTPKYEPDDELAMYNSRLMFTGYLSDPAYNYITGAIAPDADGIYFDEPDPNTDIRWWGKLVSAGNNVVKDSFNPFLIAWSGQSSEEIAIKNCAFYSPESILIDQFSMPLGSRLKPIMTLWGTIYRVTTFENFANHSGDLGTSPVASYWTNPPAPYNIAHRGSRSPFFHLHCSFDSNVNPNNSVDLFDTFLTTKTIPKIKYNTHVPYNEACHWSVDLLNKTKVILPETSNKINNYDSENLFVLSLDNALNLPELFPVLYVIIGSRKLVNVFLPTVDSYLFNPLNPGNNAYAQGVNSIHLMDIFDFPNNILNWTGYVNSQGVVIGNNEFYNIDRTVKDKSTAFASDYSSHSKTGRYDVCRNLYIVDSENYSQYGELNGNAFVLVEQIHSDSIANDPNNKLKLISITSLKDTPIYSGDVFISKFYYRNSQRLSYDLYGGSNQASNQPGRGVVSGGYGRVKTKDGVEFRMGNTFWVESEVNCNYRHQVIEYDENGNPVATGVPYYPRVDEKTALDAESDAASNNGYNIQYSFQNDTRQFFLKPFGFEEQTNFNTRTIFSEQTLLGEQTDYYRKFLANSFQDLPKNKGEITNVFVQNNNMFIHTERALFKTFVNQSQLVLSTDQQIVLGSGSVFNTPPIEIIPLQGGYAGTLHKWAAQNTPFGYFFVDYLQKKVFLFSEQLEEISQVGMYGYFADIFNFDYNELYQSKEEEKYNPNYINNPANPNALGIVSAYDSEHRRLLLTIKHGLDKYNITNDIAKYVETDNYKTLSFSMLSKSWVSRHSYKIAIATQQDNSIISLPNIVNNNNIYLHNDSVNGSFGVYYINTPEQKLDPIVNPFIIEFSVNKDFYVSKVFDNQQILVDFFSLDKDNLDSFNSTATKTKKKLLYEFFDFMEFYNSYQSTGIVECVVRDKRETGVDEFIFNVQRYNDQYQIKIPLASTVDNLEDLEDSTNLNQNLENKERLRDKFLISKFTYNNEDDYYLSLQQILSLFRKSFR